MDVVRGLIPDYDTKTRYKVVGQYDSESKVMYYDMAAAEVSVYRVVKEETAE